MISSPSELAELDAAIARARQSTTVESLRAVANVFALLVARALAAPTTENVAAVAEAITKVAPFDDGDEDDTASGIRIYCASSLHRFVKKLGPKAPEWLTRYTSARRARGERRLGELARAGWIEKNEEDHTVSPTPRLENLIRRAIRQSVGDMAMATFLAVVDEVKAEIIASSPELSDDTKGQYLHSWIASFVNDELHPWQGTGNA